MSVGTFFTGLSSFFLRSGMLPDITVRLKSLFILTSTAVAASVSTDTNGLELGPSLYTAPGPFPTFLWKHYYNNPTATSAQPQPVITNPVTVRFSPT